MTDPFAVKDCALIAIATGERAWDLRELRDRLRETHPGSVYHHFWGRLLRPGFDRPEYPNDFANWVWSDLHDETLAERLGIVDPSSHPTVEHLRREILEVIEERLDEPCTGAWVRAARPFFFMRAQLIVFDTRVRAATIEELADALRGMSVGSIFYHVIDAQRRTEGRRNDLSEWLSGLGPEQEALAADVASVDRYLSSLTELRDQIVGVFDQHQDGRQR